MTPNTNFVTERVSVSFFTTKNIGGANRIRPSTTDRGLPCTHTLGGRGYQVVRRVGDEHEFIYICGSRGTYV